MYSVNEAIIRSYKRSLNNITMSYFGNSIGVTEYLKYVRQVKNSCEKALIKAGVGKRMAKELVKLNMV